ncbi:MAG: SEC-C metal-binding domain-containing protein [Myxococcota bacterium]|jgi:hypothetical protein|nr:SEC-C metal-binding domain-containing protein [Myxococcota bacterium]
MPAPGRNDPCHCGSGQKYKKCCWSTDEAQRAQEMAAQAAARAEAGAREKSSAPPSKQRAPQSVQAPKAPKPSGAPKQLNRRKV